MYSGGCKQNLCPDKILFSNDIFPLHKGIYLFVSGEQIQKIFGLKEIKVKISSLLNVSNGRSKSEEFGLKDIEIPVDNKEQN